MRPVSGLVRCSEVLKVGCINNVYTNEMCLVNKGNRNKINKCPKVKRPVKRGLFEVNQVGCI